MNLFLIFSVILISIIFGIFLQRLIHSPILVGLIVFSVLLLISAITNNTFFIILALVLAVIAFISALLDCLLSQCNFFRNNNCLRMDERGRNNCNDNNGVNNISSNLNNCINTANSNCNSSQRLTILNSDGEIIAKINGDNITCTQNNNSTCNSCRRYR